MVSRAYAHRIRRAQNVLGGLTAHADKLAQWGITQEFIDKMTALFQQITALDQKRNAMKASSQVATTEQDQLLTELESNCTMIKRLVRFELPKEYWPEFGFREGEYGTKKTDETTETETPEADV